MGRKHATRAGYTICVKCQLSFYDVLLFSEEMTELKIQIETGFETEQDLKKSLLQLEGNDV